MFDYQHIVADIENLICTGIAPDPDLMRDLNAEFIVACDEVNERLRQCMSLLKKGLRSEAIQAAEREPNLLDAVAQLDFSNLPTWLDQLRQVGFVLPPPLLLNVASDLNLAYSDEVPLQSLLRQHRLLAMGRAPLPSRITVLRRICNADSLNPAWKADLSAWERTRLQQLVGESDLAYRNRNLAALNSLSAELHAPEWSIIPPTDLVAITDHRQQELALAHARDELMRLAPRLNAAHAAFDVIDGRAARSLWLQHWAEAGLNSEGELAQQVSPALEWLAGEDRREEQRKTFEAAVSALEHALDRDNTPPSTLERAYHAVVRFEQGIPEVLARRFAARIRSIELAGRRKFRLRMLAILGSIALIAGVTAFLIVHQLNARELSLAVEGFSQLVKEDRLTEAGRFYDDLEARSPGMAHNVLVQEVKARLDSLIAQETERQASFAEAMKRADQAGIEVPDNVAISEAKKFARTSGEKLQIAEFEASIQAARRKLQEQRDSEFLAEFRAFRSKVEAINPEVGAEVAAQITALKAELEAILARSNGVSLELTGQARALKTHLASLDQEILALEKQRHSLQEITTSVNNLDRFQGALRRYSATFGETAAAREFDRALEEVELWNEMVVWSKFFADSRIARIDLLEPAEARKLLDTGNALSTKFPHHPGKDLFAQRKVALEAIVARVDGNGQLALGNLRELFADPLVADTWMIEMDNGQRFYTRDKPQLDSPSESGLVAIEYITGFDFSTERLGVKVDRVVRNVEAPQVPIARLATTSLLHVSGTSWESPFFEIVKALLEAKDMDPVLRMGLLRRVVTIASRGSNSLRIGFAPLVEAFDRARVDLSVAWMAPDNREARSARQAAREVLDSLPMLADLQLRAGKQFRDDSRPLDTSWEWYGWLANDARGRWQCLREHLDESGEGQLLMYYRKPGEVTPTLAEIGTVIKGSVSFRAETTKDFLAGRPLYLRRAAMSQMK